jgi:hypothetical protein
MPFVVFKRVQQPTQRQRITSLGLPMGHIDMEWGIRRQRMG